MLLLNAADNDKATFYAGVEPSTRVEDLSLQVLYCLLKQYVQFNCYSQTWQQDYLLAAMPLLKRRVEVVAHHLGLRLR